LYGPWRGITLYLDHHPITLMPSPHHRPPLDPVLVGNANSLTKGVEALPLPHLVHGTQSPGLSENIQEILCFSFGGGG
jgi:hypothetical protein